MSSMTMSGTHRLGTYPEIRQPLTLLYPPMHPFLPSNHPILILVEDPLRNLYNIAFPALVNILCRLVVKPICTSDLLRGPDAVVVEVMEGEEGGRIKVRDMVLFWNGLSVTIRRNLWQKKAGCTDRPCGALPSLRRRRWGLDGRGRGRRARERGRRGWVW